MCVCVCVCVREEREGERETECLQVRLYEVVEPLQQTKGRLQRTLTNLQTQLTEKERELNTTREVCTVYINSIIICIH